MAPAALTEKQVIKINEAHASDIKDAMREFLSRDSSTPALRRPADGEDDLDAAVDPAMDRRNAMRNRRRHFDRVGDMLQLPDGVQRKDIPMCDIMASADAQHMAVLKKPWYVRETSNRDRELAKFILQNIDSLIKDVPIRCRDFDLLPEQRLAIICMATPLPVETYTRCEIPREAMNEITRHRARKMPFDVQYSIEGTALPTITIADYCTGSGKTVMAIMAALTLLCCKERWNALKADYKNLLRMRVRETHSGLCKMDGIETARLARLAIMFVPSTVLTHWYRTAQSAVMGVKDVYGAHTDVLVWKGMQRGQTIRDAYDAGKPVLLILPMESESLKVLRQAPDIGYAVRIFDELNMQMKGRYDQPESTPCFNYVTQATIESLEKATEGNPKHPMRLAFGDNYQPIHKAKYCMQQCNYKMVQIALEHFCKMRQFAVPEFLRRLVAESVQNNMPSGLIVQKLCLRAGTLSAIATGSDMIKISFPDLACSLLGTRVSDGVKKQVQEIFEKAEVANSQEILEELDKHYEGMPLLNMADNAAKQAVKRLKDRMGDILGGNLPECPITMEPIKKEDVRILKCCTAVIDVNSIPGCKGRCPLCRAPIGQMGAMAQPKEEGEESPLPPVEEPSVKEEPMSKAEGKKPVQMKLNVIAKPPPAPRSDSPSLKLKRMSEYNFDDSDDDDDFNEGPRNQGERYGAPDAENEEEDEEEKREAQDAFDAKVNEISNLRPYSVDGILQVLLAQVAMNPSSRILLCFGFENNQRGVVRQICDRITAEVQNAQVTDIDRCGKDYQRMDDAKQKFDDAQRFPAPQIFIINTTDSSSSVQGLDLYATDLTIVADQCSLHTQRQAVGRSLRMRKRPKTMKREELFPAKRIIVATISGFEAPRPAAEPAPPAPAGPIAAHVPRRAFAQAAEQRLAAARFNVFEMEVQQLRRDNPDADQAALDRRIAQMEAEVAERAAEHAAMVGEAADDSEDELDEIFPAPPP